MRQEKFSIYSEQRAFGARVREAGLSRYEVGRSLGVSPSTVAGWLAGYNRMPPAARAVIEYRLRTTEATTTTTTTTPTGGDR